MGRDLNDLACEGGADAVRLAVANGRRVAKASERAAVPGHAEALPDDIPLSVTFADELPDTFTPPDELVQGLLTIGGGSVLYGDSNSGKTFLVIDLAAAIARGVEWMGKRTEPGMIVYLAAESPASVRSRLQAYQRHHGVRVPNFAIVQNPVNLFENDADASAIIATVQRLEAQRGRKVRLIVGDTLARLSAGANENAGQDMSRVIERFDRIRTECSAHFLLIHHSGKNAAAGSRGWSGVRAAVDAEIEITDSPTGRCAEITKVRDLGTKGERIGFRLDVIELGTTKWGVPATTCVVVPTDAPDKAPRSKRMGDVEGAVLEFLTAHKSGIKKTEVVKHFEDRYRKTSIYRAMKALADAGAIHEAAGMACVATGAK
ncbi:helicase RepA family protein [Burkholderia sp. AU30280]|uniref:helicase RepA family protein n=1 Tax=Burkholderia sp. AU30280 TaxID=2879628 RepID=UPI001CF2B7A7|nr:helicase RepA family protein [Burkholderia sp. AU30280]MCA8275244.1 helicase RepA family protein [Burkholderia sp. AU30280]